MYETPKLDSVGSASELIQARFGPLYDGGGYVDSYGFVCAPLEEE